METPSPAPSPRNVPVLSRDEVQHRVEDLVSGEGLDKTTALTVTRLFHAMDLLLERAKHDRDSEVQKLKSEIEHAQLQNQLDRLTRTDPPPAMTKSMRRKVF